MGSFHIYTVDLSTKPITGSFIKDTGLTDHYAAGEQLKELFSDMIMYQDRLVKEELWNGAELMGLTTEDGILPLGDTASFISKTETGYAFVLWQEEGWQNEDLYLLNCEGYKEKVIF